jgi:type VI protein secretion system component VasA
MDNKPCKRTWNTPTREHWNAPIHHCLKAIDLHVSLHLQTGDQWHQIQAEKLRVYLDDLKTWIHSEESKN